jgi:hypothetical protein
MRPIILSANIASNVNSIAPASTSTGWPQHHPPAWVSKVVVTRMTAAVRIDLNRGAAADGGIADSEHMYTHQVGGSV